MSEFSSKYRTINDLIRFINNKSKLNSAPNFSILLGAGASITSGVKSGQALIDQWKREIADDLGVTIEEVEGESWYDRKNPYASLFEHRFDLPKQRCVFVENEVCKANPSIGYAYLVKLIENKCFNTVFTTNFDDLLSDAFNKFSSERPVICAHDSSIVGVSVTSSRPKIIKLHGDYLYQNIKATDVETDELDPTMKQKFEEFARDSGIIVVGYSGHDNSIMSILDSLLQSEEFLKNGLYWCIKKGDSIPDRLATILKTSKRAFIIEIDGFDEFFAELNKQLNSSALPLDNSTFGYKGQEKLIRQLTENPHLKNSSSQSLKDDFRRLRKEFDNSKIDDFSTVFQPSDAKSKRYRSPVRKLNLSPLSPEQKEDINSLSVMTYLWGYKERAASVIKPLDEILGLDNCQYKLELLQLYVEVNRDLSDDVLRKVFDKLIELDKYSETHYLVAYERIHDDEIARYYLDKAKELFPNDIYVINYYIEELLEKYESSFPDEGTDEEISKLISHSLELDPTIKNDAYHYRFRYNNMCCYDNDSKREKLNTELLEKVGALNKYHPITLMLTKEVKRDLFTEQYIREAIDYYEKANDLSLCQKCYELLSEYYKDVKKDFNASISVCEDYERNFHPTYTFLMYKASLLTTMTRFSDALDILGRIDTIESDRRKLVIYKYTKQVDEIEKIYASSVKQHEIEQEYYEAKGDYKSVISYFDRRMADGYELNQEEVADYSYSLLQLCEYKQCVKFLRPYFQNAKTKTAVVIVNYLLAKQHSDGTSVTSQINQLMIQNKYQSFSKEAMVGAYALADDIQNLKKTIKEVLSEDPSAIYRFNEWPVLSRHKTNVQISKLLNPQNSK